MNRFLSDTWDAFRSYDRDEAICGPHYQPKHTGTIFYVLYSFITFLWTMTHFLLFTDLSLSLPLRAIRHPSQTAVEGLMLQNEYIKCIFISSGKDWMCNCAWSHVFNNGAVNREPASSGFSNCYTYTGSKINSRKHQME